MESQEPSEFVASLPHNRRRAIPEAEAVRKPTPQTESCQVPLCQLLTIPAVARMLNVGERTVRRMEKARVLKAVRVCRQIRFHPDEIRRFIGKGGTKR